IDPRAVEPAVSTVGFPHLVSHPSGDDHAHVVRLRFDQRLPAHEENVRQVDARQITSLSSPYSIGPSFWVAVIVGRCLDGGYTARDALEHQAALVDDVDAFDPNFHVIRGEYSDEPGVVGQLGLAAGAAAEG